MKLRRSNLIQLSANLVFLFLFTSCKKEITPIPETPKSYDVINTGTVLDTQIGKYKAASWKNETLVPLQSIDNEETGAYGIAVNNKKIYIAGFYAENDKMHPCYWVDGIQKKFILDKNSYARGTALDMAWLGSKLYILGSIDLAPVMWIVQDLQIVETIVLPTLTNSVPENLTSSSRLYLKGDKLYLGAAQQIALSNGQFSYDVGYWTITGSKMVTYTSLQSGLAHARAWSIVALQNEVVLSGESLGKDGVSRATVWGNKGQFSAAGKLDPSKQRIGAITADQEGNIHAMVSNAMFEPEIASLSIHNYDALRLSKPVIPAGAKGNIKSIDFNEQLIYSCSYTLNNRFYGAYWFNNKQYNLEVADRYASYVNLTSIKLVVKD
ncbi:MAG: hypothetical protein EOO90_21775 [Pedobacter sp.]|nr:MAG: hypothetical protein EOO90_21775 [Pedobacter sp.]